MSNILIIANWKSTKTLSESRSSLRELSKLLEGVKLTNPPLIALSPVALSLIGEFKDASFNLISQDVSSFAPGAHTGQTTLEQLKDLGIKTSLVGHSERRLECGESDLIVIQKLIRSLEGGFDVIFCFGEDHNERQAGRTNQVLERQLGPLKAALRDKSLAINRLVFAYEPVWAIGTGLTADIRDIEQVSSWLRGYLALPDLRFIYGGSVNIENIDEIISSQLVDGVLIGSASVEPTSLFELIKAVERNRN